MASTLSVDQAITSIWRRKWRILFIIIVFFGLGGAYLSLVPRTYEASINLIIHPGRGYQTESSADRGAAIAAHERIVRSQIVVIESEAVLRRALQRLGTSKLYPERDSAPGSEIAQLQSALRPYVPDWAVHWIVPARSGDIDRASSPGGVSEDKAYLASKRAMRIEALPNTNIIRIGFRHPDPQLAANFVNEVAASYITRSLELSHDTKAGIFFVEQRKKYNERYQRDATAYSNFSSERQMFSLSDQRRLALERRSALTASLAQTGAGIADKEAQIKATANQLRAMKPLAHVPQIGQLLADSAVGTKQPAGRAAPSAPAGDSENGRQAIAKDPPLLLVKVYQDTVQALVRVNAELAGLRATEERQKSELSSIAAELSLLAENEPEFERLRFDMAHARELAEGYAKKAAMQQVDDDLSSEKITNIQIAQAATAPLEPTHPKPMLVLLLSGIAGALLAISLVLLTAAAKLRRSVSDSAPLYYPYAQIEGVAPISLRRQRSSPGGLT